jgi:hypothetical protein
MFNKHIPTLVRVYQEYPSLEELIRQMVPELQSLRRQATLTHAAPHALDSSLA